MKIPCTIIVGPKDVEAEQISVRLKDSEEKVALKDLVEFVKNLK